MHTPPQVVRFRPRRAASRFTSNGFRQMTHFIVIVTTLHS
jgi:hypothetical protein